MPLEQIKTELDRYTRNLKKGFPNKDATVIRSGVSAPRSGAPKPRPPASSSGDSELDFALRV